MKRIFAAPIVGTSREPEARSRLAAIVESSADAMIGKTLDGVITSWNSGAERMYGYTEQEIVGRSVSVLIPSERSDELLAMMRRIARGERVEHFETKRIRKSGAVFDVSVSISPIRDVGCDAGQGYHFSRPITADEVVTLLAGRHSTFATPARRDVLSRRSAL